MGARCSSGNIVMPSKKLENNNQIPLSDRGHRNSFSHPSDPRVISSANNTPRGIINAEKTTSVTIKQKRVQTEPNEGSQKFDGGSPLNETNNSRSTELPHVRGLYQYKKGPLIGKGSYGEVYECLNLNTGELLAVKSFKVHGDLAKVLAFVETLKKEVIVLKNLGHENIVKYYTTEITDVRDGNHVTVDIVQEYVSGGSVRKLLDKFAKLEEKVVGTYVRQVLLGLHYLHMQGIVHRNIKGSNILIDTSGTIKLTEFGYSGRPDKINEDGSENKQNSANKIPAYWSAPEVILKKSHEMPADIWSVGCVVIEMLTGLPPWSGQIKNNEEFLKKMNAGAIPTYPVDLSETCKDFLNHCFKLKPEERPNVVELLEHNFVREDDNLNNSSYMEAESVVGGLSRSQTPANFLNLIDGKHGFNRQKTNTFKRQDSDVSNTHESHFSGPLRQDSGFSGYKDIMAGFRGTVADSVSAGGSVSRQNSEDKNMLAMFKAYGFDATSRQNSADKNHLIAFKAAAYDNISRQNSEDKGVLAAFKAGAMDFKMKTEHTKNLTNFINNLKNVEEERDEEEYTPHPNGTKDLKRFGSAAKAGNTQGDQGKNKEDMRRELEQQMLRDMMRMNTQHLEEFGLTEEDEDNEADKPSENKMSGSILKNKLVEGVDPKRKGLVSEVDFGAHSPNSKKVVMITEMEMDQVKQKLRQEFEEQLEYSLARINTEKLAHLIEKEAPSVERGTTMAARMIRETMKTEDSTVGNDNNNPIWNQNFDGEVLGSFRGFSENNNNFETQHSERNSPAGKGKKVEFKNGTPSPGKADDSPMGMIPEVEEMKQSNVVINLKDARPAQSQAV